MQLNTFENRYDRTFDKSTTDTFDNLEELKIILEQYKELNINSDSKNVTYCSFSESSNEFFKLDPDEKNFIGVHGIMLDIDGKKIGCDPVSVEEFIKKFPYKCLLHTTGSHSKETPSYRVMIPSDSLLTPKDNEYIREYFLDYDENIYLNIDHSTFARMRGFAMPYGECTIQIINEDKPEFDLEDCLLYGKKLCNKKKAKTMMKKAKTKRYSESKTDCSKFPSIINYLNTNYSNKSGNGTSDKDLYHCVMTCHEKQDGKTLEKVLDKARSENWTERELDRKITLAENKYGSIIEEKTNKLKDLFGINNKKETFKNG